MKNEDNERLRKTTIAFLKDFAEKGYENAVECIDWLEEQCEKKPWSEEDERMFNSALWHVKNSCGNGGKNSGEFEVYNWLKFLKDRVQTQPNQEWSEEDEKYLKLAIDNFQTLGNSFLTSWLKFIKDRLQSKQMWKPSRKQMKDLAFVADQNKGNMVGKTMISLYKDLKKLK